ncbi:MAG: peptide chain release factor N(5)-glutamine methyltransferase [Burkholderiales bacterium]|nr:peptide chain release factor N(5)-glutamine methyltransferase [Burkholderiales bacterium]
MPQTLTIRQALFFEGIGKTEARVLLSHLLKKETAYLLAHDTETLDATSAQLYISYVKRCLKGEPVAYIIGQKECYGLMFRVTPDVLIPRPDTETLIEAALAVIPSDQPCRVLDLGTGSGVVAIAIAHHRPNADVFAADVSEAALEVARQNAKNLLGDVSRFHVVLSDWFSAFPEPLFSRSFDVIVSNPPYIKEGDAHLTETGLPYEPHAALVSGKQGLDAITHLCARAPNYLKPRGYFMLEQGYDQADAVANLMTLNGLTDIEHKKDLSGIRRVTVARRFGNFNRQARTAQK